MPTHTNARHAAALAATSLLALGALASETDFEGPVITLGSYEVTGETSPSDTSRLIGSVDIVGADQLEFENVDYTLELLGKLPGLYLTDFNQGVITADVAMRGFNAEGSQAHTLLLVDGVPHNLNNGYNDLGSIFPLEIERIEVVKGTADARYGLGAIAGSLSVHTHRGDIRKLQAKAGSYDTYEAQALYGLATGNFTQTYFAGYRESDGFRDHAATEKHSLSGKWFYTSPDQAWEIGLVARAHEFDGDAPGYMDRAQTRLDPTYSPAFSSTDGGTIANDHFNLQFKGQLTDQLQLQAVAYRHDAQRHRFVRFTAASAQQERFEDETTHGLRVSALWQAPSAERPLSIEYGLEYRDQEAINQRFRTLERQRQATTRDHLYTVENLSGYANVDWRPADPLRLVLGLRVDEIDGQSLNRASNATTPMIDYGAIWQPKLGATYTLAEGTNAFASYGRTFQIGNGALPYSNQPGLDYSKNDGYEIGLFTTALDSLTARLSLWRQDASDEIQPKADQSGDSENIGQTTRKGVDLELSWRPASKLNLWSSVTFQQATLTQPGPANAAIKGNELDHVPDRMFKAGIDYDFAEAWTAALSYNAQSDYHLTNANNLEKFGATSLLNLDLRYRWRDAIFTLHLKNALDHYSEYVWHDGAQTLHSPADKRSLYLSTTYTF